MKNKKNKYILISIVFILAFVIFMPEVFAETRLDYEKLCADENVGNAIKIIGYLLEIVKWIVPLIIIILGMVDFGKAALSNDEKAIQKAATSLIRRFVAGVVIFFIPTIVLAVLNAIDITNGIENDNKFIACTKCILDVDECGTSDDESGETGGSGNTHTNSNIQNNNNSSHMNTRD